MGETGRLRRKMYEKHVGVCEGAGFFLVFGGVSFLFFDIWVMRA